jgi:hypothetical protein
VTAAGDTSIRIVSTPAVYSKESQRAGQPAVADAIMRLAGGSTGPGTDLEVVPIPTANYAAVGGGLLNDGDGVRTPPWFSVPLPASYVSIDGVLQVLPGGAPGPAFVAGVDYVVNPALGCVSFTQQAARNYILGPTDPTGRDVIIQYTDASGPGKTVTRRLPGLVQALRAGPTWQRWASPAMGEKTVYAARNAVGPSPGRVYALAAADSAEEWAYDPRVTLYPSAMATDPMATHRAAPAADADTVYVATSFDLDPSDAVSHPDGAALAGAAERSYVRGDARGRGEPDRGHDRSGAGAAGAVHRGAGRCAWPLRPDGRQTGYPRPFGLHVRRREENDPLPAGRR